MTHLIYSLKGQYGFSSYTAHGSIYRVHLFAAASRWLHIVYEGGGNVRLKRRLLAIHQSLVDLEFGRSTATYLVGSAESA